MAAPSPNLLEELDGALKNCLAALTNQEHYNSSEQEEVKTTVEQNAQKFVDVARQMEHFFLQKRMQLSVTNPEQFVNEETTDLKQELARKEEMLQKHYEKLVHWQSIINRSQSSPSAGTPQAPGGGQPAGVPTQQQQALQQQQLQQQQQQHSQGPSSHAVVSHMQSHASYQPQGPLHYLQQTTSNIGMERR